MGICLSCLHPPADDDFDETAPLLGENISSSVVQQQYEEQILEQRNKELNSILNSTNDHLIDLTNFLHFQSQFILKEPVSPSLQNQASLKTVDVPTATSLASLDQNSTPQLQAVGGYDSVGARGLTQIEVLDCSEVCQEMEKELAILEDKMDVPFDRCIRFDTGNIGALKVEFG
ncbi:hypothetical protein KL905_003785 [Ogataea polymorpha]|uniref:Uncharacterized protein n=1 Tax=Ogataea polymorpha TaxID=460523 RepID=A0A9P8P502_9ASCO|nr:hypothetical protein KL905_003785 [Ogataea polymorpha]KAH3665124.1 hypothetical protein OGATHE_003939 [Ogataea polymorpha]